MYIIYYHVSYIIHNYIMICYNYILIYITHIYTITTQYIWLQKRLNHAPPNGPLNTDTL